MILVIIYESERSKCICTSNIVFYSVALPLPSINSRFMILFELNLSCAHLTVINVIDPPVHTAALQYAIRTLSRLCRCD